MNNYSLGTETDIIIAIEFLIQLHSIRRRIYAHRIVVVPEIHPQWTRTLIKIDIC